MSNSGVSRTVYCATLFVAALLGSFAISPEHVFAAGGYPITVSCTPNAQPVSEGGYYAFGYYDDCIFDASQFAPDPFGVTYVALYRGTVGSSTLVSSHQTFNQGMTTQSHNAPFVAPTDGEPFFFAIWQDRGFPSINDTGVFNNYVTGQGTAPAYQNYGIISFTWGTPPATTTPPCTVDCFSNVLFLPGIEGSRLFEEQNGSENKLWEPSSNSDVRHLFLKPDGTSSDAGVYTKTNGVLDELPVVGANVYKSFLLAMDDLKANGTINDWGSAPYDWRLTLNDILTNGKQVGDRVYYGAADGATTTPYILQQLRRLAASSKSGKVTIIAHSNGGLVTKALTNMLGDEASTLIDKIIFVDVPQAGTPAALAIDMHGTNQSYVFGLVLSQNTARTFASTSPMAYNLLPSTAYSTYVQDPLVTIDSSLPDWQARYGTTIKAGPDLDHFLTDSYGRVDAQTGSINAPIQLSSTLLTQAHVLHDSLDAWVPPSGISLTQIAGWGIPKTISGVTYAKHGNSIQPQPTFTIDGDGTVVVPSELWTSASNPNVKNVFVNLQQYNNDHPFARGGGLNDFNHARVLEVKDVLEYIRNVVRNDDSSSSLYLTSTSPVSNAKRLRYALHSPLTLNLYNDNGLHTGVSTTTGQVEEQIPGTYYAEVGDVKYIFTDASSTAHIVLNGYDTGTFTLNVDQYAGDTRTASTTFAEVPTTAHTVAKLDVVSDITTISPLSVYKDGNGSPGMTLVPKANGVVLPDTTAPDLSVGFATSTQSLVFVTQDESSTTLSYSTVVPLTKKNQKTASGIATTTVIATDSSGNTTTLVYTEQVPRKDTKIKIALVSITQNGQSKNLLGSNATYRWKLDSKGAFSLFAAYLETPSGKLEAHWRPKKNMTLLMQTPQDIDDSDDDGGLDIRPTKTKAPGLVIPYLQIGYLLQSFKF